jgi:uncharacterized integral membrane protein (TIGR00698 family)
MALTSFISTRVSQLRASAKSLAPGFLLSALVALAGQFIAEHYGAPAMLMALLFGIALNFLSLEGRCVPGISFTARQVLRFGIALLGMRISFDLAASLGLPAVLLIVTSTAATIAFGLIAAPFFGHRYRFAFLSSGSVAICGASAAMAISAILPQDERSEERLVFTVVGVTLLSTVAMIVYPILMAMMGLEDREAGIFIGATIHDVAQVVGAGFSISDQAGEMATVTKLLRVAMLAPVVLIGSLILRRTQRLSEGESQQQKRPPLLPTFVVAFVVLAVINSFHLIPAAVSEASSSVSRWALLTAIAAVGMKTSLRDIAKVGAPAIALLVLETLFIAGFIALGLWVLGLLGA